MPQKRKPTVARGGVIEHALVTRYIKRQRAQHVPSTTNPSSPWIIYTEILEWLAAQPKRTRRPGGIGR